MATKGVTELGPFERCRGCAAEISPGRETCPACGTLVPRSPSNTPPKPRWSTGRKISHAIIAVLVVIVANIYRPYVEPYLRLMWPPWLAPYVGEAISRVEANKNAMAMLGAPVNHSRIVRGGLSRFDEESASAQFRFAVSGTHSSATLHAVLGQVDGVWAFSELRLTEDRSAKVVDLLDRSDQPARAPLETDRRLYLVPLGNVDQEELGLKELRVFYRDKFNLRVEILRPLTLEEQAWDRQRRQVVAEDLASMMLRRLPELARDPKAVLIGVTGEAMYLRARDWNVVPTHWRGDKAGVVSSVPFQERATGPSAKSRFRSRVRKAISRVTGIVLYGLPLGDDPTSVLAQWLNGSHRADLMSDELDGLGSLAVIDGFTRSHWLPAFTPTVTPAASNVDAKLIDGSYPCLLVRRDRSSGAPATRWPAKVTQCLPQTYTDVEIDEVEVDLRSGLLMTRETDLYLSGATPVAATRCYRLWDNRVRAFGYNRALSWDMFPIGSRNPYTYIDMILCDGRVVHFDRISEGSNYADALYEHKETGTAFSRARFGWTGNGWDLGRADGAHLYFPESYNAKRGVDGALVGFTGPKGDAVTLQRDRLRNLRQLSTAGGNSLQFDYDAHNRVTQAKDFHGRSATYQYDMAGRMVLARTPNGERSYRYTGMQLDAVRENGATLFQFRYTKGRVGEIVLPGGKGYKLRYDFDRRDDYTPVKSYLTGPDGRTESFTIPPKP